MKLLITILSLIISQFSTVNGQWRSEIHTQTLDTVSSLYFPLHTGNIYVFKKTSYSYPNFYSVSYNRYNISRDTIVNSKWYHVLSDFPRIGTGLFRVDSVSGSIMKYFYSCIYNYNRENLIDSLALKVPGFQGGECGGPSNIYLRDTLFITIFNLQTQRKEFANNYGYPSYNFWRYAKNIGLYYYSYGSSLPHAENSTIYELKGCIINGTLYGDTSVPVGITQISSEVPKQYSLSQNYPNPFNPVTNIKYRIPKSNFVLLKVYDILGKEIQILVNQEQAAGTYEVKWDASKLPSGIYIYKLTTENYTETKKAVLIK